MVGNRATRGPRAERPERPSGEQIVDARRRLVRRERCPRPVAHGLPAVRAERGERAGPGSPGRAFRSPRSRSCPRSLDHLDQLRRRGARAPSRSGRDARTSRRSARRASATKHTSGIQVRASREPDGGGCGRSRPVAPSDEDGVLDPAAWERPRVGTHHHAQRLAELPEPPARPGLLQQQDVDLLGVDHRRDGSSRPHASRARSTWRPPVCRVRWSLTRARSRCPPRRGAPRGRRRDRRS